MMRQVIDGPVSQWRAALIDGQCFLVNRLNVIGTDTLTFYVYEPRTEAHYTLTSIDKEECPTAAVPFFEWNPGFGSYGPYASLGGVKDDEAALAIARKAFPEIPALRYGVGLVGHQARVENHRACSESFRTIGRSSSCPGCGAYVKTRRFCNLCKVLEVEAA